MIIAFDTETYLINIVGKAQKNVVPRMVCMSYSYDTPAERHTGLDDRGQGVRRFIKWLEDPDVELVGLNTTFDLRVLARACREELDFDVAPLLFGALDAGRIHDVSIRQQLIDLGSDGNISRAYGLEPLVARLLGKKVEGKHGPDVWRKRYSELDGVPIDRWSVAAADYARNDAEYTLDIFNAQPRDINNAKFQMYASAALGLASAWGAMLDADLAMRLDGFYARDLEEAKALLQQIEVDLSGYYKWAIPRAKKEKDVLRMMQRAETDYRRPLIRQAGTKDAEAKKALLYNAWQVIKEEPKLTTKGSISTDQKVVEYLIGKDVQDPAFQVFSRYNRAVKFRSTYLDPVIDAGDGPICPRLNTLVKTGRSSSSGPNIQNIPARLTQEDRARLSEAFPGISPKKALTLPDRLLTGPYVASDIRGVFIPRPGHVYISADYSAIEMAGLAQVMCNLFGHITPLGESINRGEDQHIRVATNLMHMSYEEVDALYKAGDDFAGRMRLISKIANYGFAGGASAATFIDYARGYGEKVPLETAKEAREAFFRTWEAVSRYFRWISSQGRHRYDANGERWTTYTIEQHGPNGIQKGWRRRVAGKFTESANTLFQGLCADGWKYALMLLAKGIYLEKDCVLYGQGFVPMQIHDECTLEVEARLADKAGEELCKRMKQGMKLFLPDIRVDVDYEIKKDRWSK